MAYGSAVEGGYDYDFVESPSERLVCKICQCPCREAQLTECCGHAFCRSCLDQFRSSTAVSIACPMCREESFTTFAQREADREIKTLKVYCPNVKDGCGWTGELASIVGHRPHQKCRCEKCDDIIHYKDMTSHLPTNCPCYCPHCDTTANREMISSEHKEKCRRLPLKCPNNCGRNNIPRENMDDHKKVCPLEMVQCKYHCLARIARNEVEKHNQDKLNEHIELTRNVLRKLKAKQNVVHSMLPFLTWSHLIVAVLCVVIAVLVVILLQQQHR